jgi:phenylalanyl-tRNA synthetase alpha chain
MLKQQPPVRIVSPAAVTGATTTDASTARAFHQLECLAVDEGISVRTSVRSSTTSSEPAGQESRVRFRPHFFLHGASFEVDFYSGHLPKVGKEWVEIGGCGWSTPPFRSRGLRSQRWSGYAFGFASCACMFLTESTTSAILPE